MGQYLKTADVRMALDSLGREEITYSRMVEMLNESVEKNIHVKHLYKFRFDDGYIFVIAKDVRGATKIALNNFDIKPRLEFGANVFNVIDVISSGEFVYDMIYD